MKRFEFLILITLLIFFRTACAEEYRIYSLVCPFETVTDAVSRKELLEILSSPDDTADREIKTIIFSEEAAQDLSESLAGHSPVPGSGDPETWIKKTGNGVSCAILPFDRIDPSMKVIRTGHAAFPWDDVYDPGTDILAVPSENSNYFPDKMTTVLLTGTTALARTVAYKMEMNGTFYPGGLIRSIFEMSDITHISNESSFWSSCPEPRRDNVSIQFCSSPEALDLLDYLGVDVIELTGNHLRDYDWMPFAETLDLLEERGYAFYGAGRTPESSAEPAILEHNGNHFVFLGCNCAGPEHVYVTEKLPGVRRCDFDRLEEQIRNYSDEGYLVIVTLQYYEVYSHKPTEMQKRDFRRLSDAGAVVVSGSQAHFPQIMVPMRDRFIHYGPGNLFFDQMDIPVKGTRQEFLDRYIFYNGRLLNVQLVTALLTDYSRPRLMTDNERRLFLTEIFSNMQEMTPADGV